MTYKCGILFVKILTTKGLSDLFQLASSVYAITYFRGSTSV